MSARPLRFLATLLLAVLVAVSGPLVGSASAAAVQHTPYEQRLLELVNGARAVNGLGALTSAPGLTDVARTWSRQMATDRSLRHNPDLGGAADRAGSSNWQALAENVGTAAATSDPQRLFDAYMASAPHKANILRPGMAYLGTGVVRDGQGSLWNTMVFADKVDGSYPATRVAGDVFPLGAQPATGLYLSDSAASAGTAMAFQAPAAGTPVACDWNGDGRASVAFFSAGRWTIAETNAAGTRTSTVYFGDAGDQPVCGDWDRDGTDSLGVYRNGTVYLKNRNTSGVADGRFLFGSSGDRAVAGDWDCDGYTTLGVFRRGQVFLTNSNLYPTTVAVFHFGAAGDQPVAGDWNGDRCATVGVVRSGTWFFTNSNLSPSTAAVAPYGNPTDVPVVGDWSATGSDSKGVYRS